MKPDKTRAAATRARPHTPAPWLIVREIDGDYPESPTDPDDMFPSRVGPFSHLEHDASWEVVNGKFDTARVEADIALMAAAPDLLAACKALLRATFDTKEHDDAEEACSAAIAKAEGRTS